MSQVLVLNGPNLNLLGRREPGVYGSMDLAAVESLLRAQAADLGLDIAFFQSNSEGALVDRVQACADDGTRLVIINPAAYTHTSVALRDAFLAVKVPLIEVHVSNVYSREAFRHHSYFTDIAVGAIVGLGTQGYSLALTAAAAHLKNSAA